MEEKMLIGSRRIFLQGRIDLKLQAECLRLMLDFEVKSSTEPIEVLIDSGGGFGAAAGMMADAIRMCAAPVVGIAVGECYSSAMVILQACDLRLSWQNAYLMFHNFSLPQDTQVGRRGKALYRIAEKSNEQFLRELRVRSGQPLARIRAWADEARYWKPKDAQAHGFLDGVIKPKKKNLTKLRSMKRS